MAQKDSPCTAGLGAQEVAVAVAIWALLDNATGIAIV